MQLFWQFILLTAEFCSYFSAKNEKRLRKCFSTTLRSKYLFCLITEKRKSQSQLHYPTMYHIMSRRPSSSIFYTAMAPTSTEFLTSVQHPFGPPSSQFMSVKQEEHTHATGTWHSPKELTHRSSAMAFLNWSKPHMDLAHDGSHV